MNNKMVHGNVVVLNGSIVCIDDRYLSIFGYDNSDQLDADNKTPLSLISEHFQEDILSQSLSQTLTQFSENGSVFYSATRSGENLAVFVFAQKSEWDEQPALRLSVFDISSQISPHQFIDRSSYQKLIGNLSQGVIVHRDFKPLILNESWAEMMGAKSVSDVLENVDILSIVPPQHRDKALERARKIMAGEMLGDSHIIDNVRLDGTKRYFSIFDHSILWEGEPALEVVLVDVTDKVMAEKRLAYKATHDVLTDLYNRDAIYNWLRDNFDDADSMSCLLIDLDDFKSLNDIYGHEVGDQYLKRFSAVSKQVVSESGVIGRWGGEEFIVFVANQPPLFTVELAEKIRKVCEDIVLQHEGEQVRATASIGVSYTQLPVTVKPKDLIRQADKKMYLSKTSGKNRVSG